MENLYQIWYLRSKVCFLISVFMIDLYNWYQFYKISIWSDIWDQKCVFWYQFFCLIWVIDINFVKYPYDLIFEIKSGFSDINYAIWSIQLISIWQNLYLIWYSISKVFFLISILLTDMYNWYQFHKIFIWSDIEIKSTFSDIRSTSLLPYWLHYYWWNKNICLLFLKMHILS